MNKADQMDANGRIREVQYAATPEGLVANGNVDAMRRFLLLSGDGEKQDVARQSLYNAAANGLCHSQDKKRVYRMSVYGWPVTLCYSSAAEVSSTVHLSSTPAAGQAKGPNGLLLKMRELWARAFGAQEGVLVSPMMQMTHLSSVVGLTPLTLRDVTRHGIALVQGAKPSTPWTFDRAGTSLVTGCADVPMTFLLSSWVCWDVHGQGPEVNVGHDIAMDMQQVIRAVGARREDAGVDVLVGRPALYHDAVTMAQGLHLAAMTRRAVQRGLHFNVQFHQDETNLRLDLGYFDPSSEDADFVQEWEYPHIWRPMEHLSLVQAYADQTGRQLSQASRVPAPLGAAGRHHVSVH